MEVIVRRRGSEEINLANCTNVYKYSTYYFNSAAPHVCTMYIVQYKYTVSLYLNSEPTQLAST